ncbi:N-formylglutamate amidohydrolase [Bauldia sp.]|uniref:N-formylglutamate amidohydrolase n=1 Tax=Bauldia sp. TaxID=2575872 RepID=UPI003BABB990
MPTSERPAPAYPAFEVLSPARQTVPLVFNSPHSGRVYPPDFLAASRLDRSAIRRSEDTYVDELFAAANSHGAPLLRANFPRAWLDVNREPYELDPKMFSDRLPHYANVGSVRVAGGLGTIARIVSESEEIYDQPLSVTDALDRIEGYHKPYHRALAAMVGDTRQRFGLAVLIDCHSMPSAVRNGHSRQRPDVVVGDRYGTSCAPALTGLVIELLRGCGYAVARNKPYAGGYITEHYGKPARGVHALQIEINRSLYMNERTLERTASFEQLRLNLLKFIGDLADAIDAGLLAPPAAAE